MSHAKPFLPLSETEEFLVGNLLYTPEKIRLLADFDAAAIHSQPLRQVYRQMLELGDGVDLGTLASSLDAKGQLVEVGGSPRLAELSFCPAANVEKLAATLTNHYRLKMVRKLCYNAAEAVEPGQSSESVLADLIGALSVISGGGTGQDLMYFPRDLSAYTKKLLERSDKPINSGVGVLGLDAVLGGLVPTELGIVAARPGVGKSALGLQMLLRHAKAGGWGLLFSLEMSRVEILRRSVAAESKIGFARLRAGSGLAVEEAGSVAAAMKAMASLRLWVDDSSSLSVDSVIARTKLVKARETGNGLVVVDYLQLCSGSPGAGNREQEISSVSRGLKRLAKEMDVPVVALSQMNRSITDKDGPRRPPQLSDLRESGAIEQDADWVLFLHSPGGGGETRGVVAKNRNGTRATVPLVFDGPTMTWSGA